MDGWQGGYNRGSFVRVNAMIGMTGTRGQLFKIERIRGSRGGSGSMGYLSRASLSSAFHRLDVLLFKGL